MLEARILGRVVTNVRAAGARCLIVSGYIDSRRGIHTQYLSQAALRVLRLRCDQAELRRRLDSRARPGEQRDEQLREAAALDRSGLPYPVLDTTGRTPAEVLAAVRSGLPDAPSRQPEPWAAPEPTPGEITWLCGPTGVGASSVGWEVAQAWQRAGFTTGFVDLQQLGFLRAAPGDDPGNHRLRAANLAAAWHHFHAYGARRMVVVGKVAHPGQVRHYTDALPRATLTLYRLHASPAELHRRIRLRGQGGGPALAGDALRGQSAAVLDQAHRAAVAEAAALERAGLRAVRVDTDGRAAAEIAAGIVARGP